MNSVVRFVIFFVSDYIYKMNAVLKLLIAAMTMLNPVALFRSGGSSRSSSSSRFLISSSGGSRASEFESSSEFSEESCMLSGSHQSTLDRLYAWEKKLYDEVKVITETFNSIFSSLFLYLVNRLGCCDSLEIEYGSHMKRNVWC